MPSVISMKPKLSGASLPAMVVTCWDDGIAAALAPMAEATRRVDVKVFILCDSEAVDSDSRLSGSGRDCYVSECTLLTFCSHISRDCNDCANAASENVAAALAGGFRDDAKRS